LFRCVALRDWGCAAGGQDGIVRLWSLSDGRVVRELVGHGDVATAIAWNGGDLLASGSTDRSARLWAVDDGRPLHVFTGHSGPVDDIAFAGETVLTVSADRTARWWSIESGEPLQSQAFDHELLSCAADRSGSLVAVGGTDGDVTVLADRQVVQVLADAHQGPVYAVELSPDGDRLLTAGANGLAHLWDPMTGAMLRTFRGHRGPVLSCALGDDVVVTGSADATVRFWDPETGHQRDQLAGLVGGAPGVDLTTGGTVIATSGGGQVRVTGAPAPIVAKSTNGNGERWRS
jgi:WD40 repeat protein